MKILTIHRRRHRRSPGRGPGRGRTAQDYPTAPVHVISGFPAGTTADISARVVGAKMGQILGQQFVIENRPGAASSIAAAAGRTRRRRMATRCSSPPPPT